MQVTAEYAGLEGSFYNWKEGIISQDKWNAIVERYLANMHAIIPRLEVGSWDDFEIVDGDNPGELAVEGGPLDGLVVSRIPENPTPEEEKRILDAGVAFIMGEPPPCQ
jgi:hypothetical protein